ncbi:hypothetical protein [uncultured Microbacterium sp.]|uniref:hypothetical protein n=1 Tax=uncultured Microbacterium sp. TaxID=191216 RepID=UPI0025D2B761|nr:hypothetical protein [uncultured Microbacterium sp.]
MDDETEVAWPQYDDPELAGVWLDQVEGMWREFNTDRQAFCRPQNDETPAEAFEVGLFATGLMASIMSTTRAQLVMVETGYVVESRAMFRSILDQCLGMTELERSRIAAVHAWGHAHAWNLNMFSRASTRGFDIGEVNREYIENFQQLASENERTTAVNKATNAIKITTIAQQGKLEAMMHQAWVEATPLSKTTMRLTDQYARTEQVGDDKFRVLTFIDSDPDSVVDPRLVLAVILPPVLQIYARIMGDDDLHGLITELRPAD